MIRLTVYHSSSEPESHLFNKTSIIIGCTSEADIHLSQIEHEPVQVKIEEQNGFLVIINSTNDPFILLNGHPFGKKLIKTGDTIIIYDQRLLFENLGQTKLPEQKEQTQAINKIETTHSQNVFALPSFSLPFKEELEALKPADADRLIKSLEPTLVTGNTQQNLKSPISLKDEYLKDWEDDSNKPVALGLQPTEQNHLYQAWKWIIFFIFSILTIAGIIGTVIYFTLSDSTEIQEVKVAQGMADISMALTYAQVFHQKPHNQNWSDIDFIKTNLQAILPEIHSYASEIDKHGQFNCCSYSLRIYTSSDSLRFLLIAQPAPSFLHWLIPKSIIVIDSQDMMLRNLKDVRSLNRLLANPDPLDSTNGKEILSLIKEADLIPLHTLAHGDKQIEFVPPKNVGWSQTGADNFIYNAPRYYRLTQGLIQKAIVLATSKGTGEDVIAFKESMEDFSRLPSLILYADQGRKSALLTKQGMHIFTPQHRMLFGYLKFNQQGKIYQAHLLKEDEELKETEIAYESFNEKNKDPLDVTHETTKQPDINHPFYIQVNALAISRSQELKPLAKHILDLIEEETKTPHLQFTDRLQIAVQDYLIAHAEQKERINDALNYLFHQYEDLPASQRLIFIQKAGLEALIEQQMSSINVLDEGCIQNLNTLLVHIDNAKTILELSNFIHIASSWLTLDCLKNSQDLIKYENLLRNKVLNQMENFILSPQKHLDPTKLTQDEKDMLQRILEDERLIHAEEREYFKNELDALIKASTT